MCGRSQSIAAVLAVLLVGTPAMAQRTVLFAGRDWEVKRCDSPCGPGPDYFSNDVSDVWVDGTGLHLTVSEHDGKWYATEVVLQASLGYGTYAFYTSSPVDVIDPCLVVGMFTWDDGAPPNYREIDFEFSRWCEPEDETNAQYVVQPWYTPGNLQRFRVDLTDVEPDLTHVMKWQPGSVRFWTYRGHHDLPAVPPPGDLVFSWENHSSDVPTPGNENARINFWLYEATPPDAADELLVTDFQFVGSVCGNAAVEGAEECDDGSQVEGDGCGADCRMEPGYCCAGAPSHCLPVTSCSTPGTSVLVVKDLANDERDRLTWKWKHGTATLDEFGNPVTGATDYGLCVFDDGELALHAGVAAGGVCGNRDCWREITGGFAYGNHGGNSDGVTVVRMKEGTDRATIKLQARGAAVPLPGAIGTDRYFHQSTAVTAQLVPSSGLACWKAEFTDSRENAATTFKAVFRRP